MSIRDKDIRKSQPSQPFLAESPTLTRPQSRSISCVIHSSHPLAFSTIKQVISSDPELRNGVRSYSSNIRPQRNSEPDVLILDTCSVECWQEPLQLWHSEGGLTIALISPDAQADAAELELLYRGAMGILPFSNDEMANLPKGIHAVTKGNLWIRRNVLSEYVRRTNLLLRRLSATDPRFTTREHQIVDLIRQGYSNKQIANVLDISERTAKFHVSNVLRKCEIENRRELLATDVRNPVPLMMTRKIAENGAPRFAPQKAGPEALIKRQVSASG